MSQADIVGTGRDETLIYPVVAKVAFVGDIPVIIIGDGIIGTFVDAGLTAGAQIVIHEDNPVITLANRLLRANVRAGGIVAMAAQIHLKTELQLITDRAGAVLGNEYQLDAVGRPVLLLAGHLTSFATPA